MADESATTWQCPKDGTAMQKRRGRGPWRCPTCGGIFVDTAAMRRGRKKPSVVRSMLTSVVWSVLATVVVRKLRNRGSQKPKL